MNISPKVFRFDAENQSHSSGYLGLTKTTPGVFFPKQIPFWSPEIAQRQVPLKKDREEAEAQIGTARFWGWIMMDHHPRPGVGSPWVTDFP